jgi:hypothetical protein
MTVFCGCPRSGEAGALLSLEGWLSPREKAPFSELGADFRNWAKIGSRTRQTSVELAIFARFRNPVPSLEFRAVPDKTSSHDQKQHDTSRQQQQQ